MNRKLKFRAFDESINKMRYSFDENDDSEIHQLKMFFLSLNISEDLYDKLMPVMQYIGLKDETGDEIYEGDICITQMSNYAECENGEFRFVVEFEDGDFWPWNENLTSDKCKIIGNIHESPELLKNN